MQASLAERLLIHTAYSTLRPELERQKVEQRGESYEKHPGGDRIISEAIAADLKEAGQQVRRTGSGGFAWGIREAIFGKKGDQPPENGNKVTAKAKETMKGANDGVGEKKAG